VWERSHYKEDELDRLINNNSTFKEFYVQLVFRIYFYAVKLSDIRFDLQSNASNF